MADQQGTGKHPHKSASDPKEHHEAASTHTKAEHAPAKSAAKSASTEHTKAEEHADGQGTGKHPHKKASDPKEHHEGAQK